jgi:molybdopterin converting factor small subunit
VGKVRVEFLMWIGNDVGPDFVSPSDSRAALECAIEDGTTLRQLFEGLAVKYPVIAERVFSDHYLKKNMVITVNRLAVNPNELYERAMADGDVVTLVPIYIGG